MTGSLRSILSKRPRLAKDEPTKPFLRGRLHRIGFYIFLLTGFFVLFSAHSLRARLSFLIYYFSVLAVYGISSAYHMTEWKSSKAELIMQKLDHACIYLLIAGTYTPICVLCLPFDQKWTRDMLKIIWFIASLGIVRSIFFTNIPKIVNVIFYVSMGFVIIPYLPLVIKTINNSYSVLFITGGVLYCVGGFIYGFEKPDPSPSTFGFHELFHLFTILANICFSIPIIICTIKY